MQQPKLNLFFLLFLTLGMSIVSCSDDEMTTEVWEEEVQQLRDAAVNFTNFDEAFAAGWNQDVSGYVPGMGHHFLNEDYLDGTFDITKPEILLFLPVITNDSTEWVFVCAEYSVPIEFDMPEGFTGDKDVWEPNGPGTLHTLHCWIGLDNPDGIFNPTNSLIQ